MTPSACRRGPTYQGDVAPILARHCLACHGGQGLAASPRLDSPEAFASHLSRMRLAVQNRTMPPWGADDTGLCGHWRDSPWLSKAEIETIIRFADRGPTEEDAASSPPPAPAVQHLRADAWLDVGQDDTPGLGASAYRCFIVNPALQRDRKLTGIEVQASDPRGVAQVTLYALESPAAEAAAEALDRQDERFGWPCFDGPRVEPVRPLGSWSWDQPALAYPAGTGIRLAAERKLVVEAHYNLLTVGLSSRTRIRVAIRLDDDVVEARLVSLRPTAFSLPPGQVYTETSAALTVPTPWTLHGAAPRMHTLGRAMQLDRLRGRDHECLANFDRWNFYDQQLFIYDRPMRLDAGDRLDLSCAYNTQSRSTPTAMGASIDDEACQLWLYVTDGARPSRPPPERR